MGTKVCLLCKQACCRLPGDVEEFQIWLLFYIDLHILGMCGYSLLRWYRLKELPLLPAFGVGYVFESSNTFDAYSDSNTRC